MLRFIFAIIVFIIITYTFSWAAIINIPADYPTIQQGIDASIDGDTVLVQPGMYVENINFNGHNIVLASLFLTTEDTSYISQTIIDGDSAGTVIIFNHQEDSTTIVKGFSITNGLGSGSNPFYFAGGITCWTQSNPKIMHNYIINNTTSGYSRYGGIYSYGSSPAITDNLIYGNDDYAVTCRSQDLTSGYFPIIKNNLIVKNDQNYAGIRCWQSSPFIINNTISENGRGIRFVESEATIKNNIIWFNYYFL